MSCQSYNEIGDYLSTDSKRSVSRKVFYLWQYSTSDDLPADVVIQPTPSPTACWVCYDLIFSWFHIEITRTEEGLLDKYRGCYDKNHLLYLLPYSARQFPSTSNTHIYTVISVVHIRVNVSTCPISNKVDAMVGWSWGQASLSSCRTVEIKGRWDWQLTEENTLHCPGCA